MEKFTEEQKEKIRDLFEFKKTLDKDEMMLNQRKVQFNKDLYEVCDMDPKTPIDLNDLVLRLV